MADGIVGQEKGAKLGFHLRLKIRLSHEHLIAMRSRDAVNIFTFQKGIQRPACAAITVDNGNPPPLAPQRTDFTGKPRHDFFRMIVPGRRQTG